MTDVTISIKASERKRPARGARWSAYLVATFFAVVVGVGWGLPLIVVNALFLLGSLGGGPDERRDDSVMLATAFGASSLGITWISMSHLAKRPTGCAALQVGAVSAFSTSVLLYAMTSDAPLVTAVTAIPFGIVAMFKLVGASKLMQECDRRDWQFSLRGLAWVTLSLTVLILPVAQALHAPLARKHLDAKTATVSVTAYGENGDVLGSEKLSFDRYMFSPLSLIESKEYRAERGVRRIVTKVVTPNGIWNQSECFYGADGELVDCPPGDSRGDTFPRGTK